MDSEVRTPVLLVCIYNKYGNVITHDYFYQMFGQYGEIKAKVWKTFVEFTNFTSAQHAKNGLDGHVVFQDGSKMNIFASKLKHIKLQNTNLGGVNYEDLKAQQEEVQENMIGTRNRRSTFQDHTNNSEIQANLFIPNGQQNQSSKCQKQSTFSMKDSESYSNKKSVKSVNAFDIDEQFREIALESMQFREMQKEAEQEEEIKFTIRRKAKTIVNNPHVDQFVMENSPSKVLFIRSVPAIYTNKSLYNIFSNFGSVLRIIFMKEKFSGLVQFQQIQSAIYAKDQLNYIKPQIKIFYSHYETLTLRRQAEGQEVFDYKSTINSKNKNQINPPSSVLYVTMVNPTQEQQIRQVCHKIGCEVGEMQWKQNGKDRWMCLSDFGTIDNSLLAMGLLQEYILGNGKQVKLSFTRSKILKNKT